jgi:hypothetical protein
MLIDRIKILRTLFDESYKKKVYIKKTDGKTAEGFIVDEDSTYYTIRDSLESPAEYKIDRKDVVAVSSEKLISKGTYYALGVIPGASQFYAGKDLKGTIFLGSSIAAWGFTGYSYYYYSKAKKDYHNVPRGSSKSTFDSKYMKYQNGSTMVIAGLSVSGVIYIAHWVDTIWFSAPDFSTTTNEPKKSASFDLYFAPVSYGRTTHQNDGEIALTAQAVMRF